MYIDQKLYKLSGKSFMELANEYALGLQNSHQRIFFLDSATGDDSYGGRKIGSPVATLAKALDLCTDGYGDTILILPTHDETISTAAGGLISKSGVHVVGIQQGNLKPTFKFATDTAACIGVGAANVVLKNLLFKCNIANQVAIISVADAGDYFKMSNCSCEEGTATGLTFVTLADADYVTIEDSKFFATTAGNYDAAIKIGAALDKLTIKNCIIIGDFDDAGIHNPTGTVATNLQLEDLTVMNSQTGDHAIELVSACTGSAQRILCITDTKSASFDAGSLCLGSSIDWQSTTGGDAGPASVFAEPDSTSNILGFNDNDNDYASNLVVANEDGSVLERLEQIQEAVNVGTGTSLAANKSLADALGTNGTTVADSAVSVLGAIGANNNNNAFDSSNVSANQDGSVLERLEFAQGQLNLVQQAGVGKLVEKSITYTGAASYNAFTVSGLVEVKVIGYITTPVTNHADTTSVGTATSAAGLIAATAGSAMGVANTVWVDNAPSKFETLPANYALIGDGEDIVVAGTVNLTAGVVTLYCYYRQLSAGATVVPA